ncbi:MAG: phosphoribosyltransferase family protein [Patescibacteria group bacterium]
MIDAYLTLAHDGNWIVVPIPLHRRRLHERGFNQAELFARAFCLTTNMDMRPDVLSRKKATKAQAELEQVSRRDNVADAFACSDPTRVKDASILLIDDVFTTCATLQEAAQTLHVAGAREVAALTLAHG